MHGGGFVGGDKAFDDTFYGNIGRFFARAGFIAVIPTYRLAPRSVWPAGTEDVAAAVGWVHGNIAGFGGDPDRIIVSGQSAGATHVAAYLFDEKLGPQPGSGVVGGILGSGFYEMTADDKGAGNLAYYGDDPKLYEDRSPLTHAGTGHVPLFLYTAEFDRLSWPSQPIGWPRRFASATANAPSSTGCPATTTSQRSRCLGPPTRSWATGWWRSSIT